MPLAEGGTVWGARLGWPDDDYFSYTLAKPLGLPGGSAIVYQLAPRTDPPLVAKIYNDGYLAMLQKDKRLLQRVVFLAQHRDALAAELPFATWPRRLIFLSNTPQNIQNELRGFSMERLSGTIALQDLIYDEASRAKLTTDDTYFIASTLADQLAKLHRHDWNFVFSDLSPANVHVTPDFTKVRFIDTDCFQFSLKGPYAFKASGLTDGYTSPTAHSQLKSGQALDATHDDFVLAILIFMLLMADKQAPIHPFQTPEHEVNDLIDKRAFPFDDPTTYPVNKRIIGCYLALDEEIRKAFTRSFTQSPPLPAHEWATLLANKRRCLQRH